ncbi:putative ribonuclease H-like domain-containing protein [Tanacetum coccineum]
MCDKKEQVFYCDTECLVLSPDFKLPDDNQVLLKVPRQNNMYSFNLENIVPLGGLACLIAKATTDESNFWHRRLGHVNFKNLNRLVKGNLVRGLPTKLFQNDHTCVACQKGKQHKASCKAKLHRTHAAESFTPNTFWAEAVILLAISRTGISDQASIMGKTPYELLTAFLFLNKPFAQNQMINRSPREEGQSFLMILQDLQRQEKEANEEAEAPGRNLNRN